MQIQPFIPGPQTKGTLLEDRSGNVVFVYRNIKNAKAIPSVGASYKMAMTKELYGEYKALQKKYEEAMTIINGLNAIPGPPRPPALLNLGIPVPFAVTSTSDMVDLNWQDIAGATSYEPQYSTDGIGWQSDTRVNVSNSFIDGLTPDTMYYFRVRALSTLPEYNPEGPWSEIVAKATVTVPITLTSITVTGPSSVNEGASATYVATGRYSNGTSKDITASVTWSASGSPISNGVLSIPANTTHNDGKTLSVTASLGNVTSSSLSVTVVDTTPVTLKSITVSGPSSVNEGGTASFTAQGLYSNNTFQNLTATATWATTGGTIAAGVLSIPANSVTGDDRTVSVSASVNGITSATKAVSVMDTTVTEPQSDEDVITLKVTFATAPTTATARTADMKANKKVGFMFVKDDGGSGDYNVVYKVMNGGVAANGVNYPKVTYTDGAGKHINYGAGFAITGSLLNANSTQTTATQYAEMAQRGFHPSNHSMTHGGTDRWDDLMDLQKVIYDVTGLHPNTVTLPTSDEGFVATAKQMGIPFVASSFGEEASRDGETDINWNDRILVNTAMDKDFVLSARRVMDGEFREGLGGADTWVDNIFAASATNKIMAHCFSHGPNGATEATYFKQWVDYIHNHPSNNDTAWVGSPEEFINYYVTKRKTVKTESLNGRVLTITLNQAAVSDRINILDMCLLVDSDAAIESVTMTGGDELTFNAAAKQLNLYRKNTNVLNPANEPVPPRILWVKHQGNRLRLKADRPLTGTLTYTHGTTGINTGWYGPWAITNAQEGTVTVKNRVMSVERVAGTQDEFDFTLENDFDETPIKTWDGKPDRAMHGLSYRMWRGDMKDANGPLKLPAFIRIIPTEGDFTEEQPVDAFAPLAMDADPVFSIANTNPELTGDVPWTKYDMYILEGEVNEQDGMVDGSPTPVINGVTIGMAYTVFDLRKYHLKLGQIKAINKTNEDAAAPPNGSKEATWYAVYKGDNWNKKVLIGKNPGVKNTTELIPAAPLTNETREIAQILRYGPKTLPRQVIFTGKYKQPRVVSFAERPKKPFRNHLGGNGFVWDWSQGTAQEVAANVARNTALTSWRIYIDADMSQPAQGKFMLSPDARGHNFDLMWQRMKENSVVALAVLRGQSRAQALSFKNLLPGMNAWMERAPVFAPPLASIQTNGVLDKRKVQDYFEQVGSYDSHAEWAFQFAARNGSGRKSDGSDNKPWLASMSKQVTASFTAADGQVFNNPSWAPWESKVGLDYGIIYQDDNERDKWWQGGGGTYEPIFAYQNGRAYAAELSAFYDGHKGAMRDASGNKTRGIKNADPFAKVCSTGIARASEYYYRGVIDWVREFRGYKKDANGNIMVDASGKGILDFPADIISFHNYQNNGGGQHSGGNRGVPPELGNLTRLTARLVKMTREFLPGIELWMGEVGYDTGVKSAQRAEKQGQPASYYVQATPPADYFNYNSWKDTAAGQAWRDEVLATRINRQRDQADWTMRTFLLNWREGVDRTMYYWARNGGHGSPTGMDEYTVYMSSGILGQVGEKFIRQSKEIIGDFFHSETLGLTEGAGNYCEKGINTTTGETVFVAWVGNEIGATSTFSVPVPAGVTFGTLYTFSESADKATSQPVALTAGGTYAMGISERPKFLILPPHSQTGNGNTYFAEDYALETYSE